MIDPRSFFEVDAGNFGYRFNNRISPGDDLSEACNIYADWGNTPPMRTRLASRRVGGPLWHFILGALWGLDSPLIQPLIFRCLSHLWQTIKLCPLTVHSKADGDIFPSNGIGASNMAECQVSSSLTPLATPESRVNPGRRHAIFHGCTILLTPRPTFDSRIDSMAWCTRRFMA